MKQPVIYRDFGKIDYKEAWEVQESLLKNNVEIKLASDKSLSPKEVPTSHHLLFCEHAPVYTLGKSGNPENLLIDERVRAEKGILYYKINRGGDITYHGPGQITGYPIFDLEKFRTDIGWYLRTMEEVMIRLLADYGLLGGRIAGATGVWLDIDSDNPRKICAMGVRCSRWVTMHGFALNINTDLTYFDYIVPCGISDKGVTSLQKEIGSPIPMEEVKSLLKRHFSDIFEITFVEEK
ncbi:MAG: lipoyl(octanoyl) transferase LipB [Bacteroidia bacterium]|nr:lipoyl(octanoyl) transferase LipB [Bacteroidia bacterium]